MAERASPIVSIMHWHPEPLMTTFCRICDKRLHDFLGRFLEKENLQNLDANGKLKGGRARLAPASKNRRNKPGDEPPPPLFMGSLGLQVGTRIQIASGLSRDK